MASQRALITGCSTGIGRATAIDLHGRGYEVIATARRLEAIEDLEVAGRMALDVDSDESVANVVAEAGPIDVLVNNAGFGVEGSIETVPLDEVRRMFETNVFGSARMIQAFLPGMRERGTGTIVNVTSTAAIAAPPLGGYYSATKYAMTAISEALKLEAGHFGIRVFAIEPGVIETSFGANALDHRAEPGPYEELGVLWTKAQEILGGGAGCARTGARRHRDRRRARVGRQPAPLARRAGRRARRRRAQRNRLRRVRGGHADRPQPGLVTGEPRRSASPVSV